jgi:3-hydroxyisobutyrate dehydrogenase-like beta-hydroxyacid dehydrogenase
MTLKVGVIGLGNMGIEIAVRLASQGMAVRGFNRGDARRQAAAARGVATVDSVAAALDGADIAVSMLADDRALLDVSLAADGIEASLARGAVHLVMSTVSPDATRRIHTSHAVRGIDLVAAPVMGRPDVAAAGTLWILAAGDEVARPRLEPVFAALSRGHTWLGTDPGIANVAKIVSNFLLVTTVEAIAEALTLAESNGLPAETYFEIGKMMMPTPVYEGYGGRMLRGAFTPAGFSAAMGLKDANLALGLAQSGTSPTPIAGVVRDRLIAALARDRGNWDLAALIQVAREAAGRG